MTGLDHVAGMPSDPEPNQCWTCSARSQNRRTTFNRLAFSVLVVFEGRVGPDVRCEASPARVSVLNEYEQSLTGDLGPSVRPVLAVLARHSTVVQIDGRSAATAMSPSAPIPC
jgi:hypothetical protein